MARRLWGAAYTVTAAILQLIIFKGKYLSFLSSFFSLDFGVDEVFSTGVYAAYTVTAAILS